MFGFWKVRWHIIAYKKSICRLHRKWIVCRIKQVRYIYIYIYVVCVCSICRSGLPQLKLWKLLTVPRINKYTTSLRSDDSQVFRTFYVNKKVLGGRPISLHLTFQPVSIIHIHFILQWFFLSLDLRLIYAEPSVSSLFICYSINIWTMCLGVALSGNLWFQYQPNLWPSWLDFLRFFFSLSR